MDQVTWWMKLTDELDKLRCWSGDMGRGACSKGELYWLGWYDAIRAVEMALQPIALKDYKEAPPQPTTNQGQNGTAGKPQVGECTTSAIA